MHATQKIFGLQCPAGRWQPSLAYINSPWRKVVGNAQMGTRVGRGGKSVVRSGKVQDIAQLHVGVECPGKLQLIDLLERA